MSLKIGVTGVGHRGLQLARAASALDDISILAIADLDSGRRENAARELGVKNTYELLSHMLESVELDAIFVLTPDLAHKDQAIAALEAGCHVLVEKPPAYSVEDTEAMSVASEKAGKHLMVAWNRTFGLLRAREVFGKDGPEVLLADYVRPNPAYLSLVRTHIVNPLYFMGGLADVVVAHGSMYDDIQEGNLAASIRFENGSLGQMTASHGSGGKSERFTAYGDGFSVFIDQTGTGRGRILRGGKIVEELSDIDTVTAQIQHFRDCCKDDRVPLNSGNDAVEIMKLTHAIMDAAGFVVPKAPQDQRGWLLWCGCGEKVIAEANRCPECGEDWQGWSLPTEKIMKV